MESLSKIIVKKYFPNIEHTELVTDAEYQIVKNCQLDDLLKTESNPYALDRICEGEKLQTAEFYVQKEKVYKRNFAKFYRKTEKDPPQPRTVRQVVPSVDNAPAAPGNQTSCDGNQPSVRDNQTLALVIASEGVMEPVRSNEANGSQHDPYLLPAEQIQIPIEMPLAILPEDENFGSTDVDGARDFLQLCTGEELPPMSMRQTMTRDMLISQLPSIPVVPPLVDNFQELDLKTINTPMFKRPLGTSTPLPTGSGPDVLVPLTALDEWVAQEVVVGGSENPTGEVPPNATVEPIPSAVETVPTAVETVPLPERAGPSNSVLPVRPAAVLESSSSSELSDTPVKRPKRDQQEISFSKRLVPFVPIVSTPKPRRNFDIFSFPRHTIWNQAIKDVQNQLSESCKQLQLREAAVMREAAPEQRIDSGFQQTPDDFLHHQRPTMNTTEVSSNMVTINQTANKERNVQSIQLDTLLTGDYVTSMQPNEPDTLGSIDGKLTEVSDRFHLNTLTEATSTSQEKTATQQAAPIENVAVLKESTKHNVGQPTVAAPDSQPLPKRKRGNRHKKTQSNEDENSPIPDVSSVLFDQAKELETVSEQTEAVEETLPLDVMIVDILLMVQGAMNDEDQLGHSIGVQRLQQMLRITSSLDASRFFKNIILLKHADLLNIECNAERCITHVSLKLPQVDEPDVP